MGALKTIGVGLLVGTTTFVGGVFSINYAARKVKEGVTRAGREAVDYLVRPGKDGVSPVDQIVDSVGHAIAEEVGKVAAKKLFEATPEYRVLMEFSRDLERANKKMEETETLTEGERVSKRNSEIY